MTRKFETCDKICLLFWCWTRFISRLASIRFICRYNIFFKKFLEVACYCDVVVALADIFVEACGLSCVYSFVGLV